MYWKNGIDLKGLLSIPNSTIPTFLKNLTIDIIIYRDKAHVTIPLITPPYKRYCSVKQSHNHATELKISEHLPPKAILYYICAQTRVAPSDITTLRDANSPSFNELCVLILILSLTLTLLTFS